MYGGRKSKIRKCKKQNCWERMSAARILCCVRPSLITCPKVKSEMTIQFSCRRKSEESQTPFCSSTNSLRPITEQGSLPSHSKGGARRQHALHAHACTCTVQFREATWLRPPTAESSPAATENASVLIKLRGTNHQEVSVTATKTEWQWRSRGVCWSRLH